VASTQGAASKLTSPRIDSQRAVQSESWPVCELCSPRLVQSTSWISPRLGISASCPIAHCSTDIDLKSRPLSRCWCGRWGNIIYSTGRRWSIRSTHRRQWQRRITKIDTIQKSSTTNPGNDLPYIRSALQWHAYLNGLALPLTGRASVE